MVDTLVSLDNALRAFSSSLATQGQEHIKPLHGHIVQRLVIEGGFRPSQITPRPPFRVAKEKRDGTAELHYDADAATSSEQTVLGGLKTKDVDVVVSQRLIGPCLAVSVKGTTKALRNLTNRMEEAAGDCTNLHISYPALVYGFLHVIRANREDQRHPKNDVAILSDGSVAESIVRYHDAMSRIAGRHDLRNDVSRYEAVGMLLVGSSDDDLGSVHRGFPEKESKLAFPTFFEQLYSAYDLRYVFAAPKLKSHTARLQWGEHSPVVQDARSAGFIPRVG